MPRPGQNRPLLSDTLTVYPTALKAESVLHERARAAGGLLGHGITTFPELTEALARDLGVSVRVFEPELAVVVLADALRSGGAPSAFRAPGRGLLRELLRVIAELESAYLSPDDVTAIAAALPAGAGATRVGEIARVYALYASALMRVGAVDRRGREWRVCEALAAAESAARRPATLAGVRRIVFAEIYDFSVLEFLIATSLIRIVGDAELVAFAHPENVDATRFLDRTWNRFVGDPAIADEVLPRFVVRGGRTGALAAVLRGAFVADRGVPAPDDGSVRVLVAPDRYREVEAAVRDVRARLEAGVPAERMAILARDLSLYGDFVEDVCRRYRVPVHFRKGRPLVANGLVKACLDVVRCVLDGFPRPRLEAILDTDYFAAAPRSLVRTLREVGFVAETARPLAECIAHRAASRDPGPRVRLEAAGRRLERLIAILRALDGVRPVAAHVATLRRTLRALGLRPVARGDGVTPAARRDARAWERLEEMLMLLAGMTRALGSPSVSLAEFLELLLGTLEVLEVEDPSARAGSVRALDVRDARGLDFDVVHLVGLDDGTFPAPHVESPLWPDAMKREAATLAAERVRRRVGARAEGLPLGGLLRTAREASLEDPFLFFLALSMAEREIVLSRPAVNERGNPTVPSPFLDEVTACATVAETTLDPGRVVPSAADCCEVAELIGRAALDRWSRRPGATRDLLTAALVSAAPDLAARCAAIDRRAAIEERRTRYLLTPRGDPRKDTIADRFVGRLAAPPTLLAERIAAMTWSPSRLEALGACGFKFFAHYVLGLRKDDDPGVAVDAAERGTLVHAVLEALFRDHPRLPADLAAARALAARVVAAERARVMAHIPAKDPALADVAWGQIAAAVDALVVGEHEAQSEQSAAGLTADYVLEETLACTLADPSGAGAVSIAGRPDRVDVHRRGGRVVAVRVVDYKMSRSRTAYGRRLDPERDLLKTGFQIPVYLLGALERLGDAADEAKLDGGYLLLRADEPLLVRDFTREDLERAAERIRVLVARARAGAFDVDPDPCDPYCGFRAVCRYQRPPLEEETAGG